MPSTLDETIFIICKNTLICQMLYTVNESVSKFVAIDLDWQDGMERWWKKGKMKNFPLKMEV